MRNWIILATLLAAGCSSRQADEKPAAARAPPARPAGLRGPQPATSRDAADAKALVERYYALIGKKNYAAARKLWGGDGAASGGNAAAFAATITPYSVYRPKVGDPTEIKVADGMQYVNVATTLHVQRRSNKAEADREGVVMLSRSTDPHDNTAGKRNWSIRGIDIRVHH